MGKLGAKDRNALLLHYFQRKDFRAVAATLGVTDDAAQKRVSRALLKLRSILARSSVTAGASSLAELLSTACVQAAPVKLALSVASASLAGAAAAGQAGLALLIMETLTSVKSLVIGGCLLLLFLGGGLAHSLYTTHPADARQFTTLDLSGYQNGELRKSWTPAYGNNHLAALGQGKRILKGVPFDIQGVVQLQGLEFKRRGYMLPESVAGIPVGRGGRRIHILHANSGAEDSGGDNRGETGAALLGWPANRAGYPPRDSSPRLVGPARCRGHCYQRSGHGRGVEGPQSPGGTPRRQD